MPNSISISAVAGRSYIEVTGHGLWTPVQLDQHFRDLDRDLRAMRTRCGAAHVLVDLAEAKVQTAETAEIMRSWTARVYREDDQVAVVCATRLLAMQIKHQSRIRNLRTFEEREGAIAWLLAELTSHGAKSALQTA